MTSPEENIEDAVETTEPESYIAKDLVEVNAAEDVFLRISLAYARMSKSIVLPAFLVVAQDRVSFRDLLKLFLSTRRFISVWMIL